MSRVYVSEGESVARGARLAEIACSDLRARLRRAKADADAARQARARLLRGSRQEERDVARQKTVAAQSVLQQAKLQLGRTEKLYAAGIVPQSTLDDARAAYQVAQADLGQAIRNEDLVDAKPLPEEVNKAGDEIAAADDQVRTIQETLDKCTIHSPIAGTVLRVWMREGEAFSTIMPTPLFTLADLSTRRVRAEVDERDAPRVAVGQRAVIETMEPAQASIAGHVTWVADVFGHKKVLLDDPSDVADRDVLEVLVTPDDANLTVPVDMRVTVKFFSGK